MFRRMLLALGLCAGTSCGHQQKSTHQRRSRRFNPFNAMMRSFFTLLIILVSLPSSAQQATWYLLSREDGCIDLTNLVEVYKLPRAPTSPEDYAQMMRERGKNVSLELPDEIPSDFNGKIVQVKVDDEEGGPAFATDEVCRKIGKMGRRP